MEVPNTPYPISFTFAYWSWSSNVLLRILSISITEHNLLIIQWNWKFQPSVMDNEEHFALTRSCRSWFYGQFLLSDGDRSATLYVGGRRMVRPVSVQDVRREWSYSTHIESFKRRKGEQAVSGADITGRTYSTLADYEEEKKVGEEDWRRRDEQWHNTIWLSRRQKKSCFFLMFCTCIRPLLHHIYHIGLLIRRGRVSA